jgi:hypothetical protein
MSAGDIRFICSLSDNERLPCGGSGTTVPRVNLAELYQHICVPPNC